jgi:hypothetical protein
MRQELRPRLGRPYPEYYVPVEFHGIGCYEMSPELAQKHFEWYTTNYFERVEILLEYFAESLTDDPLTDLERLGRHVERVVRRDKQFKKWTRGEIVEVKPGFRVRESPAWQLTNAGWVLAQDMGLLLAHEFLELKHPLVNWMLHIKPKNDPSFQRPVITWLRNRGYDPLDNSVSWCLQIVDRTRDGGIWALIYNLLLERLAEHDREVEQIRLAREREKEERRLARQQERERLKQGKEGKTKGKKG